MLKLPLALVCLLHLFLGCLDYSFIDVFFEFADLRLQLGVACLQPSLFGLDLGDPRFEGKLLLSNGLESFVKGLAMSLSLSELGLKI